MSETNYDNEHRGSGTASERAIEEETSRASHNDRRIFPKIILTPGSASPEDINEYVRNEPISGRNMLEGVVNDWATNSPISPAAHMYDAFDNDSKELFRTMMEITKIRDRFGIDISKIDSAKTAAELFKAVRIATQVHHNDLFDSGWLIADPNAESDSYQSSGYDQILIGYPYARYRFSLDMPEGFDQHQRLISFTQGNMTIFADDNNWRTQKSNIFWYQDGLLLYGSTIGQSKKGVLDSDVFIFSDAEEIHETNFHKINSNFYNALRDDRERHFETDMTMKHLRTLYDDNDAHRLGEHLRSALPVTSIGTDSQFERLWLNKLVTKTLEKFVENKDHELITDEDFEAHINAGLSEIRRVGRKLKRGNTPLYKISE
jgi:hypothetical protein